MIYFDRDFLNFFQELEKNNSKTWFDDHKKVYDKSVKEPFKLFVSDLAKKMQPLYPDVDMANKASVMRINRDIRFSRDKTPYKIHASAMILPHGKKEDMKPGMYVQANHVDVRVYAGLHELDKDQLLSVRTHIDYNLEEFNRIVSDKIFEETPGGILGEKNKRVDAEFREAFEQQPLLANKQFYWYFKFPPDLLLSDRLIDELVGKYRKTLHLNNFLLEALS